MTKIFLKQEVKDRINAKLREVLVIRQDGQCEYPVGWDDAAVANVVGVVEVCVKRLRQANFGRLFKGAKSKPLPKKPEPEFDVIAELRADIEKLQRESRAVRRWIKDNFDASWTASEPLPLKAKE